MKKQSDFEWDSDKDLMNQKNTVFPFLRRSMLSWITIVSSWRIENITMMKRDITALVKSLMEF
jgi:hypothetical protein